MGSDGVAHVLQMGSAIASRQAIGHQAQPHDPESCALRASGGADFRILPRSLASTLARSFIHAVVPRDGLGQLPAEFVPALLFFLQQGHSLKGVVVGHELDG